MVLRLFKWRATRGEARQSASPSLVKNSVVRKSCEVVFGGRDIDTASVKHPVVLTVICKFWRKIGCFFLPVATGAFMKVDIAAQFSTARGKQGLDA